MMESPPNPENNIPPEILYASPLYEVHFQDEYELHKFDDLSKAPLSPDHNPKISFSTGRNSSLRQDSKGLLRSLISELSDIERFFEIEITQKNKEIKGLKSKNIYLERRYNKLALEYNKIREKYHSLVFKLADMSTSIALVNNKIEASFFHQKDKIYFSRDIKELADDISHVIQEAAKNQDDKRVIKGLAIDKIKQDRSLLDRVKSAVRSGFGAALEELISHPVSSFVIAFFEEYTA